MKIFDLNVNGFKAFLSKGGKDYINNLNPDIICLQETRTDKAVHFNNYNYNFHNRGNRSGYAGTMVYTKIPPQKDLTENYDFSDEGRIQVLEFESFILVNVYTPSSIRDPERFSYRMDFNNKFIELIKELDNIKPVMIFGDFNCVRADIDMDVKAKDYEANDFETNERDILINLEKLGFYDPVRKLYRNRKKIYSWKSPKRTSENKGSQGRRLDYCYLSRYFPKDLVKKVSYHPETGLSDHYPMVVELEDIRTLKEDFESRKEWEQIDLNLARKKRKKLIEKSVRLLEEGDDKLYRNSLLEIAESRDVKALAVEKTLKAKTNPNIKEMNWHYTYNKAKALNGIDLEHHKMDPVHFFEVEEKGKIRLIGKLSRKDYAAHCVLAQILKPWHDFTSDEHSYAYMENKSHLDMHASLQEYLTEEDMNWVSILDVTDFFGSLDHEWMIRHISVPNRYLRNLLETDNVYSGKIFPSNGKGISLGSPAAAYLANITLNGIEDYVINGVLDIFGDEIKIRLLRFSDDIIIISSGYNSMVIDFATALAKQFIKSRKLELNEDKCKILDFRKESFNLMHWNYRMVQGNLHVELTEERIGYFLKEIDEVLESNLSQAGLIKRMNEKISGFTSDMRFCDSGFVFWEVDNYIEEKLRDKVEDSHKFIANDTLLNRNFVSLGGKEHFCLPKDRSSHVKKLLDTPLIKETGKPKKKTDTALQKSRVNECYRGIWRRQDGCCAVCGEKILPDEERNLIKINGRNCYIHNECKKLEVIEANVVFDLTTPFQIEKTIDTTKPYLTEDYIYPGLVEWEDEERRRELREMADDSVEIDTETESIDDFDPHYLLSFQCEGFLPSVIGDTIKARRQQSKESRLSLPERLCETLTDDEMILIKDFMSYLKKRYSL